MKRYLTFDKNFNLKIKSKTNIKPKKKGNLPLVNFYNIGYYIVTPILMGVFLGYFIDQRLRLQGNFVIIFTFIGTTASFYNLYKIYKNG